MTLRHSSLSLVSNGVASDKPKTHMIASIRTRFWIEVALALLTATMCGATLVSREWIEVLFGVDPDGGSGLLEWAIVAILLLATVTFGTIARTEWKRHLAVVS